MVARSRASILDHIAPKNPEVEQPRTELAPQTPESPAVGIVIGIGIRNHLAAADEIEA
jgi:hypothetical protein